MKKRSPTSTSEPVKPRGLRYKGVERLRRPRHENFAQYFVRYGFDGCKAALYAGYGKDAARVWPRLMRCTAMQERVASLASGLRLPGNDAAEVLKEAIADVFVDLSPVIRRDAGPGEPIYDLSKATPLHVRALEFIQEVTTTGGRQTVRVTIRQKDQAARFRMIAAELGINGRAASAPPRTDFEIAFSQILDRGSKAILRVDTKDGK